MSEYACIKDPETTCIVHPHGSIVPRIPASCLSGGKTDREYITELESELAKRDAALDRVGTKIVTMSRVYKKYPSASTEKQLIRMFTSDGNYIFEGSEDE